jgi:DNA-binding NtrC family response regulator
MMRGAQILVVEDDKLMRWSIQERLQEKGWGCTGAAMGTEGLRELTERGADLVLLDLRLPDLDGLALLGEMRRVDNEVPIIILTAYGTLETAVQAIQEGAYDFLSKPIDFKMLFVKIEKALETAALRKHVRSLRAKDRGRYTFDRIVAVSPKMKQTVALARTVSTPGAATVLLQGETGTGKDLLARAIHHEGPRGDRPFLEITCTALPEPLLESELFGYEKGAFTDATTSQEGLFELADGGTVFLNEIGDMSLNLQAKLLHVLEEKTFRRLGGRKMIQVDVRILAATNKNLAHLCREGRFREDLYYRLQVFPIWLPPLRQRQEDIMPLAHLFLAQFNDELGRAVRGFTQSFEDCARCASWPGNVRELRNVVERAVILSRDGGMITPNLFPQVIQEADEDCTPERVVRLPAGGIALETVERELVRQALEVSHGNQIAAAGLLHIGRDALRYRMKKYGLR